MTDRSILATPSAWLAALLVVATAACEQAQRPLFDERATAAGLDLSLVCGTLEKRTILEVNGNGAALVDLDSDGDLDVVLVDGSTAARFMAGESVAHHVLLNDGPRNGVPHFTPAGDTGLVMDGWPTGIAAGDIDADGRPDLVIGGLGEDALFLNRTEPGGPVRFDKRRLPGRDSPLDWTTSVGIADADGDGHLDLYLVRYLWIDPAHPPIDAIVVERTGQTVPCRFHGRPVMCGPSGLPPQPDVLLRGIDGKGAFEDVSEASGIRAVAPSYGLGLLFADLDADGWPDVYVANDSVDNFVLRNRGDGSFEDLSTLSGAASDMAGRAQAGMGVDLGDLGGDGAFDIVVTNFFGETNTIYANQSSDRLSYRDVTAATGLAARSRNMLGWGVALADFNVDGRLDLFVANGHVFPEADLPDTGSTYAQPCQLFLGGPPTATGAPAFGPDLFDDRRRHKGRSALRGDLDGDGDLDLLVLTLDGPPLLYVNRADVPQRQLLVSLRDGNGEAFGATLMLILATTGSDMPDAGQRTQTRQKLSSSSFQASPDPRLHFSLGAGDAARTDDRPDVLEARVLWPGGVRELIATERLRFGTRVIIERGRGVVDVAPLEAVR